MILFVDGGDEITMVNRHSTNFFHSPLEVWQKRRFQHIVANRPYLGGAVPIFYAKFPTVPIFLDCVPTSLNIECPK